MTEFGFIDHIKELFAALPDNGFEGIGDDCAVLPVGEGESLVFTTDMLAEGVHFLRSATSPRELGRKSLAVNLSDVASMGARPVATLLSLSLPADTAGTWAEEFMLGYRELSEAFGVTLAGGDTTRSAAGITINVTAIGRIADAHIKRRSGARPGDAILVAGELGLSGAGLHDILAGRYDTPAAAAHRNPQPQVAEGIWLGARSEVHAMMDLSDGLASDLGHILDRSSAGAEVELSLIPVAPGSDLRTAACGGEDYKLLLTADPSAADRLAAVPGTRASSAISCAVNYYATSKLMFTAAPGSFYPAPKVTSAVVRMDIRPTPAVQVEDEAGYFALVRAAFGQRRKTAANAIAGGLNLPKEKVIAAIESAGFDARIRPEALTLEDFAKIQQALG